MANAAREASNIGRQMIRRSCSKWPSAPGTRPGQKMLAAANSWLRRRPCNGQPIKPVQSLGTAIPMADLPLVLTAVGAPTKIRGVALDHNLTTLSTYPSNSVISPHLPSPRPWVHGRGRGELFADKYSGLAQHAMPGSRRPRQGRFNPPPNGNDLGRVLSQAQWQQESVKLYLMADKKVKKAMEKMRSQNRWHGV